MPVTVRFGGVGDDHKQLMWKIFEKSALCPLGWAGATPRQVRVEEAASQQSGSPTMFRGAGGGNVREGRSAECRHL